MDVAQVAHDQILEHVAGRFSQHELSRLVEAILRAGGFTTQRSAPGPDGGVDILAARGSLGLDGPHLCVQVKSGRKPETVETVRELQGAMQTFRASQGLLVSWSGFTKAAWREARRSFFHLRLWSANDILQALYHVYSRIPGEIQAELPLRQVWVLVPGDGDKEYCESPSLSAERQKELYPIHE